MTNSLPPGVRARIDAHLDAVETHLQAAGAAREKRRAIVDDLETQILDMLPQTKDRPASIADIDDVLNRMDPPQAYANEGAWSAIEASTPAPGRTHQPRLCRQAKQGAWYIALGAAGQLMLFWIMSAAERVAQGEPVLPVRIENVVIRDILNSRIFLLALGILAITAAVAAMVGPIVGTSCGWIATSRLRRTVERESGLRLAIVEALFYPFLIIWGTAYGLWSWMNGELAPIVTISCVAGAVWASGGVGWVLWRMTRWTRNTAGPRVAPPTGPPAVARSI
jgi:hypothetical protein